MKTALLTICGLAVIAFTGVIVIFGIALSSVNSEARLRNEFHAQEASNASEFDKMWKTIEQMAQVPVAERDSFKDTYVSIMSASKGVAGNGQLASFFQQSKIDIDASLFKKLMTTIEAQRLTFHQSQQKLTQIKKQHDDVLTTYPSAISVAGKSPLEPKLVTSTKTQAVIESGVDDSSTDLFRKGNDGQKGTGTPQ